MDEIARRISRQLAILKVLIVGDDPATRKGTRSLLQAVGVRATCEAEGGRRGLEAVCSFGPDVVLLDWDTPNLNGPEFMRRVRAPQRFPLPDVPIVMLTAYGERARIVEMVGLGVNEYLLKPISSTALLARLIAILTQPRPMVRDGDTYIPAPRSISPYRPEIDLGGGAALTAFG
jgi:two-component system, chemotaxis family, chemotaxis protein CheY